MVFAPAPSMAGCRGFSIAAVRTLPQREYLSRPGDGDSLFRKFRVTGQKFLRKAEVSPLVHGKKSPDIRRLQKVTGAPEAVLSQPGVQGQHGQVDPAAPQGALCTA